MWELAQVTEPVTRSDEVGCLLEEYGKIWHHDTESETLKQTAEQRLAYHQTQSLPIMEQMRQWCDNSLTS